MVGLGDLLDPEAVLFSLPVRSKKKLFATLGETAAERFGVSAEAVAEGLGARERLGSTGFGGGIAIPHARLPGIGAPVGIFATLATPIEFRAVDELPVDLVFALLSPLGHGAEHLKALARVSRTMRAGTVTQKLRGAASADALFALLTNVETRDAA